jgi:ferrous-iron efflux pump FieF
MVAAHLDRQQQLMRMATRASLAVAVVLLGLKVAAWQWTGSVAMLASATDSLLDALASTVAMLAVHWSLEPADAEHRFGHGKLEPLAGLVQAILVLVSAVVLLQSSVARFVAPRPVDQGALGLVVMAIASAATLALVRYQAHVVRQTGSTAVSADALHYGTDLLMNLAVAVALVGAWGFGWLWLDPLLGLVVAVLVGRSAAQIGWDAIQLLMDRELPEDDRRRITEVVCRHPEVLGLHDLRTRRSGLHRFVQFHLELDGDLLLRDAHRIGQEVEAEVAALYPGAEVLVHFDTADDEPRGA